LGQPADGNAGSAYAKLKMISPAFSSDGSQVLITALQEHVFLQNTLAISS